MMKNIDVAIWYNLYFFLKFQLIMSQIQRKFPLFHGRTWGCKLLLSKKWQYLQIPFFFSPYIQTQNLTFFMKQSVLPPSDWNDGSLFWIFCGHSGEGTSGVREGFLEEGRFRSGWKDELFTRWRKDVRSFSHSFYTHFLRSPLGGRAGGPKKSLTPSGPQGAPWHTYHNSEWGSAIIGVLMALGDQRRP